MKKIVIIGGGFAGAYIAKNLEDKFDVSLIDTKDYFEFTPGILRTIVEPKHVKKVQILHSHYLKKTKLYRNKVINISNGYVFFKMNKINYDYLIICSGSSYNSHIKTQNLVIASRANELRDCYSRLNKARKILIIGGGLVGVELASEIATHYDNKEITIVDAGDRLISRNSLKASKYAEKFLTKRNVIIKYNEFVVGNEIRGFITNKQNRLKADIAFLCTGIKPNSDFLKDNFSKNINEKGYVKVNQYLQLNENIFAAGDVNDVKEEKTAQNAEFHAKNIVDNLINLEEGKELVPYETNSRIMIISLGKWKGILDYKDFTLTGFIPGILKSLIERKTMRRY